MHGYNRIPDYGSILRPWYGLLGAQGTYYLLRRCTSRAVIIALLRGFLSGGYVQLLSRYSVRQKVGI